MRRTYWKTIYKYLIKMGRLTLSWEKTNLVKMIRISISLNIAAVARKL